MNTKKNITICLAVLGCACLMVAKAGATPIPLTPPGSVVIIPANPTDEYNALVAAIATYNTATSASLPGAGAIDMSPYIASGGVFNNGQVVTAGGPLTINIDFSSHPETYLALTWDGPNGGTQFFYVAGETGVDTFTAPSFDGHQYGLSHYMLTGPGCVPDGGLTVVLLGSALTGLGLLRRKLG